MADHHLTAPRLHIAWQANSLVWEDKRSQLVAKTHWLEPLAGYGMAILMLIYFILQGGVFLLTPGQSPLMGAFAFLVAAVIYLSMIWMVIRFIIIPYRVAMRVKPFLESIYTPNTTKKPVCADAL